jgi:hypothetical protein
MIIYSGIISTLWGYPGTFLNLNSLGFGLKPPNTVENCGVEAKCPT